MVDEPKMTREDDGELVVWDVSWVRPRRDVRFFGWILLGATIAMILYDVRGWRFIESPMEYMAPLALAALSMLFLALGGKPEMVRRPLLRLTPAPASDDEGFIDIVDGVHAPSDPDVEDDGSAARALLGVDSPEPAHVPWMVETFGPEGPRPISPRELTHVVFGMVDYPWPGREGVHVEAFAVYLAKFDGTPVPVIDGTMDKLAAWQVAKQLSGLLRVPLIEMGKGQ